jgi:hypothetical protein
VPCRPRCTEGRCERRVMESRARYQKDSATSRAGANHAQRTLSLRQRAVLAVIVANDGATIAEISKELCVPNNEVSGRITELRDDHKIIRDSGIKRATVTPCKGTVWVVCDAWKAAQNRADVFKAHPVKVAAPAADVPQLSMEFSR